jgi:acetyl esterase/lipase
MPYAYDPELAPWAAMVPPARFADIAAVRDASARNPMPVPDVPVTWHDEAIPGPENEPGAPEVPIRVYTPQQEGRDGALPAMLYIHGGGFAIGSVAQYHGAMMLDAHEIGTVVVAVDYRLAPENPFPAGLEDCYATLAWIMRNVGALGIDPARVGVVGDSAGGGLAAALTLLARDRGEYSLCFQCLGIPELDDRLETPSMRSFTDTPIWNRPNAEASWDFYLGGPGHRGADDVSPYAAPARAEDLTGLPPAYVTTCEFDPLRDEGIAYAQRLMQAGVPTELHNYPGTFHGSILIAQAAVSRRMIADHIDALRRGLRAGPKND